MIQQLFQLIKGNSAFSGHRMSAKNAIAPDNPKAKKKHSKHKPNCCQDKLLITFISNLPSNSDSGRSGVLSAWLKYSVHQRATYHGRAYFRCYFLSKSRPSN